MMRSIGAKLVLNVRSVVYVIANGHELTCQQCIIGLSSRNLYFGIHFALYACMSYDLATKGIYLTKSKIDLNCKLIKQIL